MTVWEEVIDFYRKQGISIKSINAYKDRSMYVVFEQAVPEEVRLRVYDRVEKIAKRIDVWVDFHYLTCRFTYKEDYEDLYTLYPSGPPHPTKVAPV